MARSKPGTGHKLQSIADLAAMVDRDAGTVCRWLKRTDWPFSKKAPWPRSDVPKILRWVAEALEKTTTGGTGGGAGGADEAKKLKLEKLREEIRKIRAQANQAETSLARERGSLLDVDDVALEWGRVMTRVRNGLQNLSSQVLPLALNNGMPQQASASFQEQLDAVARAILRDLSQDDDVDEGSSGVGEEAEEEDAGVAVSTGEVDAG